MYDVSTDSPLPPTTTAQTYTLRNPETQPQDRIQAVNRFKTKEIPLLIATDVAARGLDIPDVEVVINYSFP